MGYSVFYIYHMIAPKRIINVQINVKHIGFCDVCRFAAYGIVIFPFAN